MVTFEELTTVNYIAGVLAMSVQVFRWNAKGWKNGSLALKASIVLLMIFAVTNFMSTENIVAGVTGLILCMEGAYNPIKEKLLEIGELLNHSAGMKK